MSVSQLKDYRTGLAFFYPHLGDDIENVTKHICKKLYMKYTPPVQEPKLSNSNLQTGEKKWGLSFFKSLPILGRLFTQKVDTQPYKNIGQNGYQLLKQQQVFEKEFAPGDKLAQLEKSQSSKMQSKKKND